MSDKATGEWIEHDGKGMPVDGSTKIYVKCRGGNSDERLPPSMASLWAGGSVDWWVHSGTKYDITHYRIVKEN